tara:strand:+ start:162 stop:911 length:750 start_codon:yes stop_codon:yes gene_type:complete
MSEEIKSKNVESKETEEKVESSPWYYFYSVGCGFCKKVDPIVDELISEGHDILKLDISNSENKKISDALKNEYKTQCGTPWFINTETGKSVCGFKEKNILLKWLAGEDIPTPPRPKGPIPKPPLHGASKKEENSWKKQYKKWLEENSHLPKTQTADEILARPRPKSEPPKPPIPNSTDEQFDEWVKVYDKWRDENSHLPNLQPGNIIVQRFKARTNMQQPSNSFTNNQDVRLQRLEQKMDKIIKHLGIN